jgi:hypothetical protein
MSDEISPDDFSQTEFVTEAIDTTVTEAQLDRVTEALADAVANFCESLADESTAVRLLTSEDKLTEADTAEKEDPEPLTQRVFIEPLFTALGYDDLAVEVGDLSETYGKKADYAASFEDVEGVESRRLLAEAEPLNKPLDGDRHGLGQVEDWLSYRPFDADFGIATDGLRWLFVKYDADTYSLDVLADVDLQPVARAMLADHRDLSIVPEGWTSEDTTELLERFVSGFEFDNVVATARDARQLIRERRAEITDQFYDEYVSHVFGRAPSGEERPQRSLIRDGIRAPENATGDDVRLFAVELMNRLVFVKFLEDRGLVEEGLLRRIASEHRDSKTPLTMYEAYFEPLFFGVLDERQAERNPRIRTITRYSEMPYLNGGLFRPSENYTAEVDDTNFDVLDPVMFDLVELLETYEFSTTGGPADLDPSILGNVFEKTINYITTDAGDQKKELGAYYTPDEITRFCADQTVLPGLRDAIEKYLCEEKGFQEEGLADADDVFELVERFSPDKLLVEDVIEDVVDQFRALDPACGSGHFLTSVENEIVRVRKALYDVLYGQLDDDDPRNETPPTWKLRKNTVVKNIYGVDIVKPAVEIAKLRLWLSIISEVEPGAFEEYEEDDLALPNIVFSIQQGNSLVGFTDLVETTSEDTSDEDGGGSQAVLNNWGPESVEEKYSDVIELMEKHEEINDTEEASEYLRRAEATKEKYRPDLDEKIHAQFTDAGLDVTVEQVQRYDPFHWVLEFAPVYADGGFDVIVGNPPWERLKPLRDDYFVEFDPSFRTRLPEDKDATQEELLEDEEIAEGWEGYLRDMEIRASYFQNSEAYELQRPKIAGRTVGTENDLSALFLERVYDLAQEGGYVAKVLPGTIFTGASGKGLRMHMLEETSLEVLVHFMNGNIFEGIDNRYKFSVAVFENGGETDELLGAYREGEPEVLEEIEEFAFSIPRSVLLDYSPEARVFPLLKNEREANILRKIVSNPSISDSSQEWYAQPYAELHRTSDTDRFVEDESEGDYPVLGGKNVHQYAHNNTLYGELSPPEFWSVTEERDPERSAKRRIREKNFRLLKRGIYEAFDGSGSQKAFVNDLLEDERGESLSEDDVLLDSTEYRVVYRDVTSATNERTLIGAMIPPGTVCTNTLHTIRPYEIAPEKNDLDKTPLHSVYERVFSDEELFALLGLINSIPFDHLLKTKIDTHIVMYKFEESQVPHLTAGDDWFEYISHRAARLNCYGEEFAEMRDRLGGIDSATAPDERERLRAEIDAAAFHAYGLNREETAFVLDDFHRVENPRLMTEGYFQRVLDAYDRLAEVGPKP